MSDLEQMILEQMQPESVDVWALLGYEPTEKQERFHACEAHAAMYGGAMGSGKSKALTAEALRAAVHYPGIRVGAFRRTFDELAESFIAELAKFDYGEALGATWNKSNHTLTFSNRSVIRFRYAETVEDASRRQGGEYQLILFDEAGLVPGEVIEALEERQRSSNPRIPVLGLRLASNPGGVGHSWLKKRFIDSTDYGERETVDDHGRTVAFIPAKATDNPHLDDGYDAQLDAISDPERRRAMRDGDWDVLAGAAFGEWDRELTVVPPFDIPSTWRRVCGIDWGWSAAWSVHWGAIDPDGRVWLYRELYETKVPEREQAQMILEAEAAAGEFEVYRVLDPACWAETGLAPSVATSYLIEGCTVTPAHNNRLAGISRYHQFLRPAPACLHHRSLGLDECPMLHVSSSCVNWLRTVPSLPRDPRRPEDINTTVEDHAYDSSRYLLMCELVSAPQFNFWRS